MLMALSVQAIGHGAFFAVSIHRSLPLELLAANHTAHGVLESA